MEPHEFNFPNTYESLRHYTGNHLNGLHAVVKYHGCSLYEANQAKIGFIEGLAYAIDHKIPEMGNISYDNLTKIIELAQSKNWTDARDLDIIKTQAHDLLGL